MTNLYEYLEQRDIIPVGLVGFISVNSDGTLLLEIDPQTVTDSLNDYFEDDPQIDYGVVEEALKLIVKVNQILITL